MFLINLAVNKKIKWQKKFPDNRFHNISRLIDVLTNFSFTRNETMRDCYLQIWYV